MSDRGCNGCRAGVIEIIASAMKREQTDLSAGLHCAHCGTVWRVDAVVLVGQAKADVMGRIIAVAKDSPDA